MRDRKDILADLVRLNGNLADLIREISQYSWDYSEHLIIIRRDDLADILKRSIDGNLSDIEIEDWANVIECRDDLGFEDDKLQEIVFELANPEIHGRMSVEWLQKIMDEL